MKIPVVYSQAMVADSLHSVSPSAQKPAVVAHALRKGEFPVDFVEPEPAELEDLQRVHEPRFVAANLIFHHAAERVAIIDVDYHYGDGTDDILAKTGLAANVMHVSFGKDFKRPDQATAYLDRMRGLKTDLARFAPSLILYSAGVDTHIEDPLGGLLSTEEIFERDETMFTVAKGLSIPIVFNLAGGYQKDADGGISKVVKLHLGTFSAALRVYST